MKTPIIFVVDSNPVHRGLVKYHLNINKFDNVHAFQSEEECLYRLHKNMIPDFLITDYNPHDNRGFNFLHSIKKISRSIHLILFSSFDDPILALKLFEAGASDYILKTNNLDFGLTELMKNIKYMVKENTLS